MKNKTIKLKPVIPLALIGLILCAFLVYTGIYYHADSIAEAALVSDAGVIVSQKDYGWFFDGPSDDTALILYPGAKVEAAAYAPLCRALAENGFDVCLVEMPFKLAFLGKNKADSIISTMNYDHWYIAGHSLGGVEASSYAAAHPDKFEGVILLASYTVKKLDASLKTLLIYGTEDKVIDMKNYEKNLVNISNPSEHKINGGNHGQFGSYGPQKGDGTALITQEQQIDETVRFIVENLK